MPPRVKQYALEEAQRTGVIVGQVLAKHPDGRDPHPAKQARAAVMNRLRSDGFSLTQIGGWLGVHHTTVIYWTRHASN